MELLQTILSTGVGLAASVATALVTHTITKKQERRKYEREIAARLAEMNSVDPDVTRIIAIQHAEACLVIQVGDSGESSKYFLPSGCRLTLGRGANNNIIIDDPLFSSIDATLLCMGPGAFLEPLQPQHPLTVNGNAVNSKHLLKDGDVVSKAGTDVRIRFVQMQTQG